MQQTVSEIANLWGRTLKSIEKKLNDKGVFQTFLSDSYVHSIEGNRMNIVVNSELASQILSTRYASLIKESVEEVFQTSFEIIFETEGDANQPSPFEEKKESKPAFFANARLNPSLDFDNFVVGVSNRNAYQAAMMISRTPGKLYNPLMIYGASGLGKTHLLQAIGNYIQMDNPRAKILYISASDFVDEFVNFARGSQEDIGMVRFFRTSVDVLLIDDIQYLVGKRGTMLMFFDVFQTLYNEGKQIVLTSDRNPGNLDGLDERLKTRFAQGLVLQIERPDQQTSEEILRRKLSARGIKQEEIDEEVVTFLAKRFSQNVRELEGAVNSLLFHIINSRRSGERITTEMASEATKGLISSQENGNHLSESKIIDVVADYYHLTPSQLTGRIRTSQIALARHIAMYLIRDILDTPFDKIGRCFGGKDHSTVMNGIKKVEKSLKEDPDLAMAVNDLKSRLKH